ncbi:hypothetical protein [Streptomyces chilikensis]|uniref:Uncharacterized protein n=1 Tax=Streptomyces chilikensis TaxID=1194079 RepID=A0ABV3EI60_9ACTN
MLRRPDGRQVLFEGRDLATLDARTRATRALPAGTPGEPAPLRRASPESVPGKRSGT